MIRRAVSFVLVVYALGFIWFAAALPQPSPNVRTDIVVIPTGGPGRIEHGLEVVAGGRARKMLVTGVDREVKPREFAAQFEVPDRLMECCVVLGYAAVDTRSNAAETAAWVADHRVRSIRLVTTDWHMRRAAGEIEEVLPEGVTVVRDAVRSEPSLPTLFLEYNKLIASALVRLLPA
ncbi:YdcF family protein [Tsuneonella amylolytica]|uniref:YdcF family protein n=1 Tax=Tsuneonella amylolytica TaxID=2338327 RepID=UPI000EA893A1|nr:YdcF family protein [Tsuneonella amylolytica]